MLGKCYLDMTEEELKTSLMLLRDEYILLNRMLKNIDNSDHIDNNILWKQGRVVSDIAKVRELLKC